MSTKTVVRPLIGVSLLALGLSACSSGAETSSGGGSTASGGDYSVQFVNPLPKYPAWRQIGDCIAKEVKKRGVEFTETGPTGQAIDQTVMIQQIQQAISSKKSAIITFPASDGFAPVLQQAQKAGIVTTTTLGSGTKDSGADLNIGVDWKKIGDLYVKAIAKRPGTQNVGLIAAGDTGPGKEWMDGIKAAAAKTDNVKVVGAVYTGDDSAKALQQTSALITAHPDVNVIATHMGTVTQGAVSAIKAKGLTDKVAFVGNGHDNGGTEALQSGGAYALFVQDVCDAGIKAADATVDRLEGKTKATGAPTTVLYGVQMATKDDLQSYLDKGWS